MSTVTIERTGGQKAERLKFIAWRHDRVSFYARPLNANGKPCIVALTPVLPEGATWHIPPFPECAPVKIAACRLLPPPCRRADCDWKSDLCPEPWESAYLTAHDEMLFLSREDDKALREFLKAYIDAAREDYNKAMKVAAVAIEDKSERSRQIKAIEHHYNGPLRKVHGFEQAGVLKMTLDMVKRGYGEIPNGLPGRECIRDVVLVKRWAEREGVDLSAMDRARAEFREWVEAHAAIPMSRNMESRTLELDHQPWRVETEREPGFMALCASIRYRVDFEHGPAAYVADCPPPRNELLDDDLTSLRARGVLSRMERKRRKGNAAGGQNSAIYSEKHWQLVKSYYEQTRCPKNNGGLPAMSQSEAARRTAAYALEQGWQRRGEEKPVGERTIIEGVKRISKRS